MSDKKPLSEAQLRANKKYDKLHSEYVTFKTKKGARERIKRAAIIKGETTNGFIRNVLNEAVRGVTGQPME